jgi:hypothetical protein
MFVAYCSWDDLAAPEAGPSSASWAFHLIASLIFDEMRLALRTYSHNRFAHFFLDNALFIDVCELLA